MNPLNTTPKSIAIIGKGESELLYRFGERPIVDEVWGINNIGMVYPDLDKLWVMDDIIHSKVCPFYLEYLRNCKSPIITSISYKECPASIVYPLEEVRQFSRDSDIMQYLFASTIAYMLLYAEMIGVMEIHLYGVDFTEENQDLPLATAFCLGRLAHKGVKIILPKNSRLLHKKLYGYRGE